MQDPPPAVAACWLHHAAAIGGPGLAARWAALAQGYERPPGKCTAPFTQARGFSLRPVDEDGDCFYSSVNLALGTMMPMPPSVPALRMVVAERARARPARDAHPHPLCVSACVLISIVGRSRS